MSPTNTRGKPMLLPIAAAACALAALLGLGQSAVRVAGAVVTPEAGGALDLSRDEKAVSAYAAAMERYVARTNGRSMFFIPPKPTPPPTPPREREPEDDRPPPPPSKPTSYGGPAIIGMFGNSVWFADGTRISLGEEDNGIRVVSLGAPWSARLEWKEVEFDVPLFDRVNMRTLEQGYK